MQPVLGQLYAAQDEARALVFWMRRWADPALFPGDLIADYFQAVSSAGYVALYRGLFLLGVDPLLANQWMPLPLTLLTTLFCFLFCLRLCPVPVAAFIATLALNANLWMKDDLPSGTPRAFFYPLMLAFLLAMARRSAVGVALAMGLLGLFYPVAAFIAAGMLCLWLIDPARRRLRVARADMLPVAAGLAMAAVTVLPFAAQVSPYNPVISGAEAATWPEFQDVGRTRFFFDDPVIYWVCSPRTSLLPVEWCRYLQLEGHSFAFAPVSVGLLVLALAVPVLMATTLPRIFPRIDRRTLALPLLFVIASLVMFAAAHLLLFQLHLPSRYVQHTLRIVAALAIGVGVGVLMSRARGAVAWLWALAAAGLAAGAVAAPLAVKEEPIDVKYVIGDAPGLYQYLAVLPSDILVATLAREADELPLFAGRRVLFSHKHSVPYHLGYYLEIRRRARDMIAAQYAEEPGAVRDFIRHYHVTHLIVHEAAFTPQYVGRAWWSKQFPQEASDAIQLLGRGGVPALARMVARCGRARSGPLIVVGAGCILNTGG
jgi:hypothetical protein